MKKTKEAMEKLTSMSISDLKVELAAKRRELFDLRMEYASPGGDFTNVAAIPAARHAVARVLTALATKINAEDTTSKKAKAKKAANSQLLVSGKGA